MGLKSYAKTNFQNIYAAARAARNAMQDSKTRKFAAEKERVIHAEKVSIKAPLSKLYLSDGPKRLNLIFADFNAEVIDSKIATEILTLATNFAAKHHYVLRIISRNNLPNPKLYTDFLAAKKLTPPQRYSFYTDSSERISSPVYRLEVSDADIFFTVGLSTNDAKDLKGLLNAKEQ